MHISKECRQSLLREFALTPIEALLIQHIATMENLFNPKVGGGHTHGYQRATDKRLCAGVSLPYLLREKLLIKRWTQRKGKHNFWYLTLGAKLRQAVREFDKPYKPCPGVPSLQQDFLGKRVTWGSDPYKKVGVIVAVVPSRSAKLETLSQFGEQSGLPLADFDLSNVTGLTRYTVQLRDHLSYLVVVDRGAGRKPALFWPKVKDLTYLGGSC